MFRIRRIHDDRTPQDRYTISQVQETLRKQFPLLKSEEIEALPKKLRDPFKSGFRRVLFVSERAKGAINGFAIMDHAVDLQFCFLDYLSAAFGKTGRGIGSILYEEVRKEAKLLNAHGLYFECLPDTAELSPDPNVRKQNAARLRFYEQYGARPIINTAYATPVREGQTDPPFIVFDGLGANKPPSRDTARKVVRAILETKYAKICSPDYIDAIVHSIKDDPVLLRPYKYAKAEISGGIYTIPLSRRITLIVSEGHEIHHVHSRGYIEAPVRINSILKKISETGLFTQKPSRVFNEKFLFKVHDPEYIRYFKKLCKNLKPDESVYPYVFPIRNVAKKPRVLSVRAGYYCIDTFTPLTLHAYEAARHAVDCALTAAQSVLEEQQIAYALVRPPGHHAERVSFGGFCYFNSTAIAADYLSAFGRVAVLDIDYHHGNGQQDIFYHRKDVLTVSIHGHPNFSYPYFSGFAEERGVLEGLGYNKNIPLPEGIDGVKYANALKHALKHIRRFKPDFLVIAFGLDTARNDPTGSWMLRYNDFYNNGTLIGGLGLKTLVVQEGGYDNRTIGHNAAGFFIGLWKAAAAIR